MLLIELPAEILMGILDLIPLVPPTDLATLMLVNKAFLKLAEERLYCDLDMNLSISDRRVRAVKCLETLKEHASAAGAVRSIAVSWAGPVDLGLRELFVESLECTTCLSTLSLSNSPVTDPCTNTITYPPLFPKRLPPNFLPSLSALNADTLDSLAELVPKRPVHTVRIQEESVDVDSIGRVTDALRLSTSPTIQHLQIKMTVPNQHHILPIFSKIIVQGKLRNLATLGLQFKWSSSRVDWGFLKDLLDKMASDLASLQDLRVISLVTLPNPEMEVTQIRPLIEEARNDIARRLPLLKRIEVRWEGWERDPSTGDWKPIQHNKLLRLHWILRDQITTQV